MHFFAEMEVRREGVLGEVDEQITDKDYQCGGLAVESDRVGCEIEERYRNHEPGRERDHVLEGPDAPAGMGHDRGGADYVGAGCHCCIDESGSVQELATMLSFRLSIAVIIIAG